MPLFYVRLKWKRSLMKRRFLLILIFLLPLWAIELKEVIDKTIQNYQNLKSFYVEFTQEFCEKASQTCQSFEGKIYFLSPNFFRMEMKEPKQIYVGDSISLWVYFPDKKKAIRQHFGFQMPFAVNPDLFLKDYNDRFNAELRVNKNYEIILSPKEETEIYKRVAVLVNKEDFKITGITVIDNTDSENRFIFKNIQLNKKISKKLFKFNPPKGTEIIEQ